MVPIATVMHIANTDVVGQRGKDCISRKSQFKTAAGLDFELIAGWLSAGGVGCAG
jgi:hypothetical protein